jgi:2-iminoacetate synthase
MTGSRPSAVPPSEGVLVPELLRHVSPSSLDRWRDTLASVTLDDVVRCLAEPVSFSLERLATLVSPAAVGRLEEMAQAAHRLTLARFGRTMQLYAPLYLSNVCNNRCRYCGFNLTHTIERTRLDLEEAVQEARLLADQGYRDLLLVSGEDPTHISLDYLCELASMLRGQFSSISVEIYPLEQAQYGALFAAGVEGVTLYQETYLPEAYAQYHLGGPKASFERRLAFQEGAAGAGMRRLGIGVLLGLSDWRLDALALGLHGRLLMQHYWRSKVSFSFPRIQPAEEVDLDLPHAVSDREMTQMILALRLCFPDAGLVLSTRESESLRNHLIPLGITQMSAGSSTAPGGYGRQGDEEAGEQFSIADERSATTVAEQLLAMGYEPVWKDWDSGF